MSKIDHHNSEKVTWIEFTQFLKKEGHARSIANTAAVTRFGYTRARQ